MRRALIAEGVGTFGIVFSPCALAASGPLPGGQPSLLASALVSGLAVTALVYALGAVSGAHFNPAVTLGLATAGRFPWRRVPGYVGAQFLGAIAAAALVRLLFGPGHWGAHLPAIPSPAAFGLEATLTFGLMLVIMGVATDRRAAPAIPGLAIGFWVVAAVLIGGTPTGGSMNPARSAGPALFSGGAPLATLWLYLLAPCLGAPAAALLYESLRPAEMAKNVPEG